MSKIATLAYHCSKCDSYFDSPGECPVCKTDLEPGVMINIYELHQLITKMATPEGVVNLLEMFKAWTEK